MRVPLPLGQPMTTRSKVVRRHQDGGIKAEGDTGRSGTVKGKLRDTYMGFPKQFYSFYSRECGSISRVDNDAPPR